MMMLMMMMMMMIVMLTMSMMMLMIMMILSGLNHTNIAETYDHMGSICSSRHEYEEALAYYEKAMNIKIHLLGQIDRIDSEGWMDECMNI